MVIAPVVLFIALAFGPQTPTLQAQPAPQTTQVSVSKIKLEHMDGAEAAKQVRDAKISGIDFVTYDPTDNSLVVRGDASGTKTVRDMVAKIDAVVEVRKFKLRNADAGKLAKKLGKPIPGIDFISSDPTDNSIVARGTPAALAQLAKSIRKLDKR